jgi:hypothetical protein
MVMVDMAMVAMDMDMAAIPMDMGMGLDIEVYIKGYTRTNDIIFTIEYDIFHTTIYSITAFIMD